MGNASRTLALMPLRVRPSRPTQIALDRHTDGRIELMTTIGRPGDEARNDLWARARARADDFDFVFLIDSDVYWLPQHFNRLRRLLETHPDEALIAANSGGRAPFANSFAARSLADYHGTIMQPADYNNSDRPTRCENVPIMFAAFRAPLLYLFDDPFSVLGDVNSEDFSFMLRLRDAGVPVFLDRVPVWHYDADRDLAYVPSHPPFVIPRLGGNPQPQPVFAPHVQKLRSYGAAVDRGRFVDLQRSGIDAAALMRAQAAGRDFRNVEDVIAWSRAAATVE